MLNLLTKLFLSISLWIHFSKSKFKRNEIIKEENRKTHINFYRNTFRGRNTKFTHRDTKKSNPLKKSGQNNSLVNSQSFANNTNKQSLVNFGSFEKPLFKK
jgi:hypothetical protein